MSKIKIEAAYYPNFGRVFIGEQNADGNWDEVTSEFAESKDSAKEFIATMGYRITNETFNPLAAMVSEFLITFHLEVAPPAQAAQPMLPTDEETDTTRLTLLPRDLRDGDKIEMLGDDLNTSLVTIKHVGKVPTGKGGTTYRVDLEGHDAPIYFQPRQRVTVERGEQ